MNRLLLAALIAAAAGATMPSFAHGGGGSPGGFHGGGFHGGGFRGNAGFVHPAPFRGVAGFPAGHAFYPHHHHHSGVFVGAAFGFPAYYYYPGSYPVYYAASYPVEVPAAFDGAPVMRLYCPDPAGYFPDVRDCAQDWVQVPGPAQ